MSTLSTEADGVAQPCCWPARSVLRDSRYKEQDSVCATIWPIRSLDSEGSWFEELHLWTEGFEASTSQRARIQSFALERAFRILGGRDSGQLAVTLSFGTVERHVDHLAALLERYGAHSPRLVIILRGSIERLRSRYRLRAFVEYLRILEVPVGYLLTTHRVSKEVKALELLQPDFAKVAAPRLARIEPWLDLALEARVASGPFERLIVSGLETQQQVSFAKQVGIPFGQGSALAPSYAPPHDEGAATGPEAAPDQPAAPPAAADGEAQEEHALPAEGRPDLEILWNPAEGGTGDGGSEL